MEGESKRKKGKMEKGIKKGEREGLKGKGHCLQGCLKDEPSGDLPEPPSRLQAVGSSRRLSPGPSRTLSTGGRRGVLCSSSRPGAGRWRRTASPPPSSECPWSPRSARRTALSTAGRAPREGISQGQQPGAAARGIIQGHQPGHRHLLPAPLGTHLRHGRGSIPGGVQTWCGHSRLGTWVSGQGGGVGVMVSGLPTCVRLWV